MCWGGVGNDVIYPPIPTEDGNVVVAFGSPVSTELSGPFTIFILILLGLEFGLNTGFGLGLVVVLK